MGLEIVADFARALYYRKCIMGTVNFVLSKYFGRTPKKILKQNCAKGNVCIHFIKSNYKSKK